MKKLCILMTLLTISFSINAKNLQSIVDDYYFQKSIEENFRPPRHCTPNSSCFQTACDSMDNYECDDIDEQDNIRRACRGVWGGDCISNAKQFLHRFEYDRNEEMVQLVNSCRGVYDIACVSYSCNQLGRFGCDDLEEITRVNAACSGNLK